MTTDPNLPLSAKVELWRQKQALGTLSLDEMREIVATLRQGRISAGEAATSARKSTKKVVDAQALERELDDL